MRIKIAQSSGKFASEHDMENLYYKIKKSLF